MLGPQRIPHHQVGEVQGGVVAIERIAERGVRVQRIRIPAARHDRSCLDVDVLDAQRGAEVVGELVQEALHLRLPALLRAVKARLVLEVDADPVVIRVVTLPRPPPHLAGNSSHHDGDRVNAHPVLAHEIEVDHVGQHAVVMLQHQVEVAVRVRLVALRQLFAQRLHRRVEVIRVVLEILVDHVPGDRDSRHIPDAHIHQRPVGGLCEGEQLVGLHRFPRLPSPLGEQVRHASKEVPRRIELDSRADQLDGQAAAQVHRLPPLTLAPQVRRMGKTIIEPP